MYIHFGQQVIGSTAVRCSKSDVVCVVPPIMSDKRTELQWHVAPTILTGRRLWEGQHIPQDRGVFCKGAAVDLEHDVGRNENGCTVFIPEILISRERFRLKIILCGRGTSRFCGRNSSVR